MGTNSPDEILWYIKNFEEIWRDKLERSSIFSLDYEAFSNIFSSENLNVKSEYIVWKALHDWVNSDTNNRKEHLPDLIHNCLRFGLLDEHFIDTYIFESESFMSLSDAARLGVKMFIKDILQKGSSNITENLTGSSSPYAIYFCPRNAPLLACIGHNYGKFEYYDSQHNSWHSSKVSLKVPNEHRGYKLAQLGIDGSELYALGAYGDNPTSPLWSRRLSDPSSEWTARANMMKRRKNFCCVVHSDNIYVMGGIDESIPFSSCERYSSQLNKWSTVADMNSGRAGASAAVLNGCIYIAGGASEEKVAQSVEKYDPQSNEWSQVAPMITARWAFALSSYAGRLWAIGGIAAHFQPLSLVESYDPVTDSWQEEVPLSEERCDHAAIEFNGKLYVVGGRGREMPLKTVETYTPNQGWNRTATMRRHMIDPEMIILPRNCKQYFTFDFSNGDPLSNMNLYFSSKEDAIEYCERHGLTYQVDEPQERKKLHKLYADNFSWSKRTRVGSK